MNYSSFRPCFPGKGEANYIFVYRCKILQMNSFRFEARKPVRKCAIEHAVAYFRSEYFLSNSHNDVPQTAARKKNP